MDLNYLFHRQQVEKSKAETARSEAARTVHEELAREYEKKISHATNGSILFPADGDAGEDG